MSGSFYKKRGVWYVRTHPVTGKATSTGQKTVALRDLWYKHELLRSVDPDHQAPIAQSDGLNSWCNQIVDRKRQLRTEETADFYRVKLGHIVRVIGIEICKDVNAPLDTAFAPDNWDTYAAKRLAEGARATTIKKEIECAKVVAKAAKRKGVFKGDRSLFRPEDLSDDYEPGDRFLSYEEMLKLLAVLSDSQRAHVAASVAFAARYSEAFRVTPGDVDLETWTVHIKGRKTKSSNDRIPIAEPFRPFLLMALPFLPLKNWTCSNQWRDLAAACGRAGIPPVTSNDLRRTHASWLTEAGVPDSITSRVMRHVDERMVRTIYGRARPEKLSATLDALFNVTRSPSEPANEGPSETALVAPVALPGGIIEEKPHHMPGLSRGQKAGRYRGVCWNKKLGKWHAQIAGGAVKVNGRRKSIHLGFFEGTAEGAEAAARKYDAAARKAFGRYALLNFPEALTLETSTVTHVTISLPTTAIVAGSDTENTTFSEVNARKSVMG